jgi:hypothetical protein
MKEYYANNSKLNTTVTNSNFGANFNFDSYTGHFS